MTNEKLRNKNKSPIYSNQPTNISKIEGKRVDLSIASDPSKASRSLAGVNISLWINQGTLSSRVTFSDHAYGPDFRSVPLFLKDIEAFYERIHLLVGSLEASKHSVKLVSRLAEEGWLLYSKLFSPDERALFAEFREGYLAEESTADTPEVIQPLSVFVKSRGLHIPWEFLYTECPRNDDDKITEIDEKYFFGYWAFVRQDVTPNLSTRAKELALDRDAIRIFSDHHLEVASTVEAPCIQRLFESQGYRATIAPDFDRSEKGRAIVSDIEANPTSFVHFACHSESRKGAIPFIRVSRDYTFDSDELRLSVRNFKLKPVAFVNSCQMALMDMERYCDFVGYFFERGFSALLATEIRISDPAAWDFASRVYRSLFHQPNGSLMRAVFSARRQMLSESGSLVGFTYCYYGLIDIVPMKKVE